MPEVQGGPQSPAELIAPAVLIVGAGWIGRQVGLRMAICGVRVYFSDRAAQVLSAAQKWMQDEAPSYMNQIVADPPQVGTGFDIRFAEQWKQRVVFGASIPELVNQVQIVLECVSEQIALKRRVLREISSQFSKHVIIASNSSYFTPSTLVQYVDEPQRFANWHFHVPLHRSSIADISGSPQTEPWVLDRLEDMSKRIGQHPLRLRHEQSGYVFNWMLQSLLRSALELAAKDIVDIQDIDLAWKSVSGMPIGPFAMMDHIGLDTIEQALSNARWDDSEPIAIEKLLAVLRKPIEQGHLGLKSGHGFYNHQIPSTS